MVGATGIILDNVAFENVKTKIQQQDDKGSKNDPLSGKSSVNTWTYGATYEDGVLKAELATDANYERQASLLGAGGAKGLPKQPYFERVKPQYADASPSDFAHSRDKCKGETSTQLLAG
jgi:hypothetical protein